MKSSPFVRILSFLLLGGHTLSASIPFTGKLSEDGVNFHGTARFDFQIVDGQDRVQWTHDDDVNATLGIQVVNGRYSVVLGGQGMQSLPTDLFLDKNKLFLRVSVDLKDGQGLRVLSPDHRIFSVAHSLTTDLAKYARRAGVADEVSQGSVTRQMLGQDLLSDLNQSIKTITREMLPSSVLSDLNRTVLLSDLSPEVSQSINRTVTHSDLSPQIKADLNRTITRQMLGQDLLSDLNQSIKTITREMLPSSVLSDLNRTVLLSDLSPEVSQSINRTVTKSMLGQDVLSDLNRTITASNLAQNTITTAQLNEQILKYLKPEITLHPQAPGLIFGGQTVTLHSRAEGKYLTYQWYKNGQPIAGATDDRYVIEDVNGTLHDGNYSLVVSNDFGTVTTQPTSLVVNGTPTTHTVLSANNLEMIFCPPGSFMMGQEGVATPVHQVTLTNGFYLGKYEVTQAQYETVMTGNSEGLNPKPSNWPNNNDRPVDKVSWNDIQIFLGRLNNMEQTAGRLPAGWKYVLPTEAQWEYACRAGTTTAYSWGNDINSTRANYNWDGGAYDGNDSKGTVDVGQFSPNPWGFFDMHGNVWEWVYDWWENYPGGSRSNPEGPALASKRILRGGSWHFVGEVLQSSRRTHRYIITQRGIDFGFRLAFQAMPADTGNPELILTGNSVITHSQGLPFIEPGVEAHDARDGNITDQIVVTGTVDMNNTGTYLLTYTVQDAAGNPATATRTVTVVGNHTVDLNATVALDMIWVQPGTFVMGSPTTESDRGTDETEHNVTFTQGFYLGKYEVTQAQYEAVIGSNPSEFNATGNGDRPVEDLNWTEALAFCEQLTIRERNAGRIPEDWAYVLPTESQWEYACRAGTTTVYFWGDDMNSSHANYSFSGVGQTQEVGQYAANPWGFFDMHGNVWEWTADWYAVYPSDNPAIDPTGPASGSLRVYRGGSRSSDHRYLRSAKRYGRVPSFRYHDIGFRVGFQKSQ